MASDGADPAAALRSYTQNRQTVEQFVHAREEEFKRHEAAKRVLEGHREVLSRLRKWHDWDVERHESPTRYVLSKIGYPRRPPRPSGGELKSLAAYYFPPRASLNVTVCDFGLYRFERTDTHLGDLENFWRTKPTWSIVRWIHVPVGVGLANQSIEDLFLHATADTRISPAFGRAGSSAWPVVECEVLNIRGRQYLQEQLDVFNILRDVNSIGKELNEESLKDNRTVNLRTDIQWRAGHLGMVDSFWQIVYSDMPWQLSEGVRSNLIDSDIDVGINPVTKTINAQMLSRHPKYRDAVLVRDLLRCLHRSDGFLLTMLPTVGVNYLSGSMTQELVFPSSSKHSSPELKVSDHVLEQFFEYMVEPGMASWPSKTLEWLLVYLLTEYLATPHALRAYNLPKIQNAYLPIVRDLKRRRGDRFRRHKSVDLVREYVACMDEISQIQSAAEQKLEFLQRLRTDCEEMEASARLPEGATQQTSTGGNAIHTKATMTERVDWAMETIKVNHQKFAAALDDLKSSLDVLFQLRTIEQNELAILANSNNKAILVFTVVTIIFLPLSFFTSYFGMNLQGIVNTDRTERYFWAVCGSVTLFVVSFTVVFGFKERLHAWAWESRRYSDTKLPSKLEHSTGRDERSRS